MTTILHITTHNAWVEAQRNGAYTAPSLRTEGFIHCSTPMQTPATANAFFRGIDGLVLLVIHESKLKSELKYEAPADNGEADPGDRFPHVYGPINLDAVDRAVDFSPGEDGSFELPDLETV